jgi:hypothetical protein
MSFQFLCPQGHLLQAELQHVGRECRCPFCGTACLIPWPYRPTPPPLAPERSAEKLSVLYQLPLVHVPCPAGHVLETPCEMLGEKALCPFCHAQFDLQLEDSLEYKTQMAEQQERREQKSRQIWFYGVIIATAAIVLMLILLILKNVK